jgi:hypothetical protein
MDYLHIDDGKTYKHHADILNKLGKKTAAGKPYRNAQRGRYEIKPNKQVVFLYRAERSAEGGWKRPEPKVSWINIPDADGKIITEIAINDDGFAQNNTANMQWAVFMDTKTGTNTHVYVFYGIFTRTVHTSDNATATFKRISPVLDLAEWR